MTDNASKITNDKNEEENTLTTDKWHGWGTGITCDSCGNGELRVEYNEIWCNGCGRQGNIVWNDSINLDYLDGVIIHLTHIAKHSKEEVRKAFDQALSKKLKVLI